MIGKLGYMSYGKLWYKMPMVSLEDGGLRLVTTIMIWLWVWQILFRAIR